MEPTVLSRLVNSARAGDREARDELVAFHRPFIYKMASRFSGRALHWENDEELSVALVAFDEALNKYEARRDAGFLTYAATVIRLRLIDYFRREARHPKPVTLSTDLEGEEIAESPAEVREAWARYEAAQEESRMVEEIDLLTVELSRYGITVADLAAGSPKHRDTKRTLLMAARTLLQHPELVASLKRNRMLPLKELQELSGVSRKVLETGRRYIVAVAVIYMHPDLPRIRNHVRLPEFGEVVSSHG